MKKKTRVGKIFLIEGESPDFVGIVVCDKAPRTHDILNLGRMVVKCISGNVNVAPYPITSHIVSETDFVIRWKG